MSLVNTASADPWLRPYTGVDAPRVRLVCLPYAGGTAPAFRSWPTWLPPDVEVIAVQYPGRQDRFAEPCAGEMADLVTPIAQRLRHLTDAPLVVFGHSMGASVAYEVTVELERLNGSSAVNLLVVSGNSPPHRTDSDDTHQLSDAELIEEVRRHNSSFTEALESPELVELLLPMIRADYRVSETYLRTNPAPVSAPVLACGGDADPDVDAADLADWSVVASGAFDTMTFPGGHFYLADDEGSVVSALASRLP